MASSSKKSRNKDPRLLVIGESPGTDHLEITGCRLPTYKQVLLCYMALMDRERAVDTNSKLERPVANMIISKVMVHYNKANIETKGQNQMAAEIIKLNKRYQNICKKMNPRAIEQFRADIKQTMQFYMRNTMSKMNDRLNHNLSNKDAIEIDIQFLKSMMSDREATYESRDTKFEKRESAKKAKYQKQIERPSTSVQSAGSLSIEESDMIDSENERMDCDTNQNQVLFTPPALQE